MSADHEITTRFKAQTAENIRPVDLLAVVGEHFEHRAAGLDEHIRRKTLAEQALTSDAAVREVDVGGVVDDSAVDLLGHTLIEAPVARLHVKDWNPPAFCGDHRQAAIGVSEDEQSVGPLSLQNRIDGNDDVTDCVGGGSACAVEEVIRLSDPEVIEEDLI